MPNRRATNATILSLLASALALAIPPAHADETPPHDIETIVMVRHGEKPSAGLGQLSCKGLYRALKLPDFFARNFPKPDFLFAPNPAVKTTEIHGDGQRYDYVRPLLTIGPTAVRLGMPIDTQLPFNDPGLLADELLAPKYRRSVIYAAWEHMNIVLFAEVVMKRFGSAAPVPAWDNADFDTVFVLTLDWSEPRSAKLQVRSEGLGELGESCPEAAPAAR